MRTTFDRHIETGRVLRGDFASAHGDQNGAFVVLGPCSRKLQIIVSNGTDADPNLAGWEHVSATVINSKYPPNWEEMCWLKKHFWRDDETVLQFHPPLSRYVNIHPNCLHLWRQVGLDHVLPPSILV